MNEKCDDREKLVLDASGISQILCCPCILMKYLHKFAFQCLMTLIFLLTIFRFKNEDYAKKPVIGSKNMLYLTFMRTRLGVGVS